jgi:endonuclease/exonuclease/phosphatase family metal-dependent hydrolase
MKLRIATFNLENWDDVPGSLPALDTRIAVVRPMLLRMDADILCLQEVNGQGDPRELNALNRLLEETGYADFHFAATMAGDGGVFAERNLVIASRFPIAESRQFKHEFAPAPQYRKVTTVPPEVDARDIEWERPALYARIDAPGGPLHVVNLHLKSRIPTAIAGQQLNSNTWRSISGFAEGFFVSAMKRLGQALEVRMFIDMLFDADPAARIAVCGDFNADLEDVPLAAIRGDVEDTGNGALAGRVMLPCERTVPASTRFSLYHQGRPSMIDHILLSRPLLPFYRRTEVHNELLHDESIAFAVDTKFPEPDHAPVIAEFDLPAADS